MTDPTYKKPKDGRYHVDKKMNEIEPVVEPLTELDEDEDAIDRLLIDTGFETDDDYEPSSFADNEIFPDPLMGSYDQIPASDEFIDDVLLANVQVDQDDYIEPVELELDSAFHDAEIMPAPLKLETEFNNEELIIQSKEYPLTNIYEHSAEPELPMEGSIEISGLPEDSETVSSRQGIENNPDFISVLQEKPFVVPSNIVSPELERHKLNEPSVKNLKDIDFGPKIADIERKAAKAYRIAYLSIAVAVLSLLIGLCAAYLDYLSQNELSKMKDMVSILEEDMIDMTDKQVKNDLDRE